MANPKKSLYEILGVPHDAMDLDIGLAHSQRVSELQRAVPPDPGAQVLVHQAFEVLSNPKRRAAYDASLVTAAEKAAAAEQASPDLVLEGDEEENPAKRFIGPAIGVVVALIVIGYFVMRGSNAPPPPPPVAEAPPPPPPPPAPKPLTAVQATSIAMKSTGRVMSYTMSGSAVPLGLALSVESGAMVTTCHGIPAGSQVVVKVGPNSISANLDVTDEVLDLCRFLVAGFAGPPIPIATDEPRVGDAIFVVSASATGGVTVVEGTVKGIVASPNGKVLGLSVPVSQGASGGAVLDTFGHLVGITTFPQKIAAGANVALPASWLAQMRTRNAAK